MVSTLETDKPVCLFFDSEKDKYVEYFPEKI